MKLKVTLEIEVADLPDDVRDELADGLSFRADDDNSFATDLDPVPRLSDMTADEITDLPYLFFEGVDDYEALEWYGKKVKACRMLTKEGDEARHALDADGGKRASSALANTTAPAPQVTGATYSQVEYDEAYEIGKRDGYSEAVQQTDQLTGGDGEYRYCLGDEGSARHTPGPSEMIQRIIDRFETLNLLDEATKSGRDQEWGDTAPSAQVTVPVDPTGAMIEAALAADWECDGDEKAAAINVWHAMLAASEGQSNG